MRIAVVIALLTVGCYSPSYRDCEITCASGSCPSGLMCDQGVCRVAGQSQSCAEILGDANLNSDALVVDALPDGSPDVDSDMDGLNDSVDNCRFKSNADQFNEDNDPFGDVCDPCPPLLTYLVGVVPQDANEDLDSDGVGAGCDPNPSTTGDRLALFWGFATPVLPNGTIVLGPWTFINGGAQANVPSGSSASLSFPVTGLMQIRSETVRANMSITQFPGGAMNMVKGAGVVDVVDSTGSAGVGCLLGFTDNQNQALMLVPSGDQFASPFAFVPFGFPIPITTEIAIVRYAGMNQFSCRTPGTSRGDGSFPSPIPGTVGLHARSVSTRFDWIMVVDSPATP